MYFAIYLAGALLGVGILLGLYERFAAWRRMRHTLREPARATHCPACRGNVLTVIGPDFYQCERCQTTWGTGLAAIKRARRTERLQQLSPEARVAFAIERLDRAEEHFYFAQQWVADGEGGIVSEFLFGTSLTHDGPSADLRNDALVACERECVAASEHFAEALEALGRTLDERLVPHIDQTLMWADDFFGSDMVSSYAANQVWRVQGNVDEALKLVRTLRSQLQQDVTAAAHGASSQP